MHFPQSTLLLTLLWLTACQPLARTETQATRAATDTCDDPDASLWCSFNSIPLTIGPTLKIAPEGEPGHPMLITGTLYKADGKTPAPGVILYAYHTDNTGLYSKSGNEAGAQRWHGRLHGWLRTDSTGVYTLQTIRPARYPSRTIPAHIHAAVLEPGKTPYYINDFVFADDSLVTPEYISGLKEAGGDGIVTLEEGGGLLVGERDIVLKGEQKSGALSPSPSWGKGPGDGGQ